MQLQTDGWVTDGSRQRCYSALISNYLECAFNAFTETVHNFWNCGSLLRLAFDYFNPASWIFDISFLPALSVLPSQQRLLLDSEVREVVIAGSGVIFCSSCQVDRATESWFLIFTEMVWIQRYYFREAVKFRPFSIDYLSGIWMCWAFVQLPPVRSSTFLCCHWSLIYNICL